VVRSRLERKAAPTDSSHSGAREIPPRAAPLDHDELYRSLAPKPVPFINLGTPPYRGFAEEAGRANPNHVVRAGLLADGAVRIEYLQREGERHVVLGVRHVLANGTVTLPGSSDPLDVHPVLAQLAAELEAPRAGPRVAGVIASAAWLDGIQHLPGYSRFEGAEGFESWGESWAYQGSPMKPPAERHARHGIGCPECGTGVLREVQTRRRLTLGCSSYPTCRYSEWAAPERLEHRCPECEAAPLLSFYPPQADQPERIFCECGYERDPSDPLAVAGITCPSCSLGGVAEKWTRRGTRFWGCTRYPECDWSNWDRPVPIPCPACDAEFQVQKARGERQLTCLACAASAGSSD
jgi:ssDNA-binding Zn-finger/Zn-ribbon topoisomerase 1